MPSGSPPSRTLALLLFLSVAATGCVRQTLEADQLERRLGRSLSDRLGVEGIEVDCPDDVAVHEGDTFACIARAPGETAGLRIRVTQVDDEGHVTWEIAGIAG